MADGGEPYFGHVVEPEPFSEASYLDSVTTIFNDVMPQSVTSKPAGPEREHVHWVRFEDADINDIRLLMSKTGDLLADIGPPQLLSVGYKEGYQLWLLHGNGRAEQLVSDNVSSLTMLRVVRTPAAKSLKDHYADKRPLMLVAGEQFVEDRSKPCTAVLSFYSMVNFQHCHAQMYFKSDIMDIQSNHSMIAVATVNKISILNASTLDGQAIIRDCYVGDAVANPMALGDRWLAYQCSKLSSTLESRSKMASMNDESYTVTLLNAAKTVSHGFAAISGAMSSAFSGSRSRSASAAEDAVPPSAPGYNEGGASSDMVPGVLSVLDIAALQPEQLGKITKFSMSDCAGSMHHVIAHLTAHHREPIVHMNFDRTQYLLLTCGQAGRTFHLHRVFPHCSGSALASVQHLYSLHRGDTEGTVLNSSFSIDSRWVSVSTQRGTTHVFPVSPYGGPAEPRTHVVNRVVDKSSRYQTSAGLDDTVCVRTYDPECLSSGPSPSSSVESGTNISCSTVSLVNNSKLCLTNRRYPLAASPYTPVKPLQQIKHYSLLGSSGYGTGSSIVSTATALGSAIGYLASHATSQVSSSKPPVQQSTSTTTPPSLGGPLCVASTFAAPRFARCNNPAAHKARRVPTLCPESLFVMTSDSRLVEHRLDPHAKPVSTAAGGLAGGSGGGGSILGLNYTSLASWDLLRCMGTAESRLPLPLESPVVRSSKLASETSSCDAMLRAFSGYHRRSHASSQSRADYETGGGSNRRADASGVSAVLPLHSSSPSNISLSSGGSSVGSGIGGKAATEASVGTWLQHVETSSHPEPHRRLWMGPQVEFRKAVKPDASPASCHSYDFDHSGSATLPPNDDDTASAVLFSPQNKHRSMPMAMKRRRDFSGSLDQNMVEVYGSWPEVEPTSSRNADDHSLSSREVEQHLMEAMRDSSLTTDSDRSESESNSLPFRSVPVPVPHSPEHMLIIDPQSAASAGGLDHFGLGEMTHHHDDEGNIDDLDF